MIFFLKHFVVYLDILQWLYLHRQTLQGKTVRFSVLFLSKRVVRGQQSSSAYNVEYYLLINFLQSLSIKQHSSIPY